MFRWVVHLSVLILLVLSACEVQFLPYGEETPTLLETQSRPEPETAQAIQATLEENPNTHQELTPPVLTEEGSQPTRGAFETPRAIEATPTSQEQIQTSTPEPEDGQAPQSTVRRLYRLQPGSPSWLPNYMHPDEGCNWSGVAGQIFDTNELPVRSLVIEVGGSFEGSSVQSLSLTGVAPAYGPGGYEVVIGNQAVDSSMVFWLQVKDLSGKVLSEPVFFDTFADCNRNLVLINFIEAIHEIEITEYFFPLFYNIPPSVEANSTGDRDTQGEGQVSHLFIPLFYTENLTDIVAPPAP